MGTKKAACYGTGHPVVRIKEAGGAPGVSIRQSDFG